MHSSISARFSFSQKVALSRRSKAYVRFVRTSMSGHFITFDTPQQRAIVSSPIKLIFRTLSKLASATSTFGGPLLLDRLTTLLRLYFATCQLYVLSLSYPDAKDELVVIYCSTVDSIGHIAPVIWDCIVQLNRRGSKATSVSILVQLLCAVYIVSYFFASTDSFEPTPLLRCFFCPGRPRRYTLRLGVVNAVLTILHDPLRDPPPII